jgi:hypothetical protein
MVWDTFHAQAHPEWQGGSLGTHQASPRKKLQFGTANTDAIIAGEGPILKIQRWQQ